MPLSSFLIVNPVMGQCHSLQMLAFGFDHLPFSLSFSFSRALAFLLSCSHSVACLLLACRLEHNTAGGLGGALYYDSCNKLDKSCMVQGVGPLSSSRAILLRDNSARAGGAIFVECKDMGSICTESFGEGNKIGALPDLPKVEFARNSASSYGNTLATKAVSMVWHDQPNTSLIDLVPGQQPLSLTVQLVDSQGNFVKGSKDIIEVLVCPTTGNEDVCTFSSASLPAVNQGFDPLTGLSVIEVAVECTTMGSQMMSFQVLVIGATYIPMISGRIQCNMCTKGQRMVRHASRDTWSCERCVTGTYNVEPLTGKCLVCPSSAACVNGIVLFEASSVRGTIEMELDDGMRDETARHALAARIGVEVWQIMVLTAQVEQQRRTRRIEFTIVAEMAQISELASRIPSEIEGVELDKPERFGPQIAKGEVWEVIEGQTLHAG